MDIENEFEDMLNERADGVEVRPDLDAVLQGSRVIRTSPSDPAPRTSPLLLVSAGIAASLIFGLIGLVLLTSGDSPAPVAGQSAENYFPVLGELPESIPQTPYASIAAIISGPGSTLTAFVGQLQNEQWTSVSRITVLTERPYWTFNGNEEDVTLDGLAMSRLEVGGVYMFTWQQADLWVLVTTELSEPTQLLKAVRVSRNGENEPNLSFDSLPAGFTLVAEPNLRSDSGPADFARAAEPNLESDSTFISLYSSDAVSGERATKRVKIVVISGGISAAIDMPTLDLVEISNVNGLLMSSENRWRVAWEVTPSRTALLTTLGLTRDETLAIARDVTFVDEAAWRQIYDLDRMADIPATTIALEPPVTTTTTEPVTTTTTIPEPEQALEFAWSEIEAERQVTNFLAALAAGAYEQAAWSAFNNGIIAEGQMNDELPAEAFERLCADGACAGPYSVQAEGPGIVDPEFSYATSTLTITHIASGAQKSIQIGTFEGQLIIAQLPPLVPSNSGPTLVEKLFGNDIPTRVVVQRFNAFEIWEDGKPEWITHWLANDTNQIEGDVVTTFERLASLRNPQIRYEGTCARLMTRDGEILALARCNGAVQRMFEVISGDPRPIRDFPEDRVEVESSWVIERGGTLVHGASDAEGNSISIKNLEGVDLLGDDYASFSTLSADGTLLIYLDHRDPNSTGTFWSPVVVLKDTSTGTELGRWILDNPALCLEVADGWILACESGGIPPDQVLEQIALVAINVETGEINRVETPVRLFLPS